MKRILIAILFISYMFMGCSKHTHENTPTQEKETKITFSNITLCPLDSIKQLPWAQTLINGNGSCAALYPGAKFSRHDYQGGTVFQFSNYGSGASPCRRIVYNCDGTPLITIESAGKIWDDFNANGKNEKVLWSLDDEALKNVGYCSIDSIQQLPWAQTLVSGKGACGGIFAGATFSKYEYKGGIVFFFSNPPSSLGVCNRVVYTCTGKPLINFFSDALVWNDFHVGRKNEKILWRKDK